MLVQADNIEEINSPPLNPYLQPYLLSPSPLIP
jgi:hypothetical protein